MTKEDFLGTKILTKGRSREIQEVLFKYGIKWNSGDAVVLNEHAPILYIYPDGCMLYSNIIANFKDKELREIFVEDILELKKDFDVEQPFKPFEKVLVRNGNDIWRPEFFARLIDGKFSVIGGIMKFTQCVAFEGNEDKVFTNEFIG